MERPFFNVKNCYFMVAVYDDGLGKDGTHSYMRPEGVYDCNSLLAGGFKESEFNTPEVKPPSSLFYYNRNSRGPATMEPLPKPR